MLMISCSPDWPRYASHSPDIYKYLDKVCETFDLRKYMTFNSEVIGCYWNEEAGQWTVKLRQTNPGSAPREFEEKCDLLLHATGILNNFKWPDIEGLEEFKGKVVRKLPKVVLVLYTTDQSRYCSVA
jgi:hydroxyversicolorone monooxygenase